MNRQLMMMSFVLHFHAKELDVVVENKPFQHQKNKWNKNKLTFKLDKKTKAGSSFLLTGWACSGKSKDVFCHLFQNIFIRWRHSQFIGYFHKYFMKLMSKGLQTATELLFQNKTLLKTFKSFLFIMSTVKSGDIYIIYQYIVYQYIIYHIEV